MMTRPLFRRNRALLGYGAEIDGESALALEINAGTPPLIVDDPRLFWAVNALPATAFEEAQAKALWASEPDCQTIADALWDFCLAESLVESADGDAPDGPYQGYHAATRSYPFLDMSATGAFAADNALMRQYAEAESPPPVYDIFPSTWHQQLRKVEDFGLDGAVSSDVDRLSVMFDGAFGERFKRELEFDEDADYLQVELIFKSIPSGGSRHPTEVFAYIDADSLPAGLYHYNVKRNSLDLLEHQPDIATLAPLLSGVEVPEVTWFLCSRVERAMWRYRDPRSFRAIVVDAGHAHHQFSELARLNGYQIDLVRTPDRRAAAAFLAVDPVSLPVIAIGLAVRS